MAAGLAQSFETLIVGQGVSSGMGGPMSEIDAAWVTVESDDCQSSESEWNSPCASPRATSPTPGAAGGQTAAATASKPVGNGTPATVADDKAPATPPPVAPTPKVVAAVKPAAKLEEGAGAEPSPAAPKPELDLKQDYHAAELESVVELSKDRTYRLIIKTQSDAGGTLAMFVGDSEGKALSQAHRGWKWQSQGCRRPLTYDFLANAVEALGRKVSFVRICASERGVFYARVHFEPLPGTPTDQAADGGVDSRPSDALNLALRCNASIYVHRQLISEAP